ncbi:unnamed protein product, partial [Scytosiphon promiscuus]
GTGGVGLARLGVQRPDGVRCGGSPARGARRGPASRADLLLRGDGCKRGGGEMGGPAGVVGVLCGTPFRQVLVPVVSPSGGVGRTLSSSPGRAVPAARVGWSVGDHESALRGRRVEGAHLCEPRPADTARTGGGAGTGWVSCGSVSRLRWRRVLRNSSRGRRGGPSGSRR